MNIYLQNIYIYMCVYFFSSYNNWNRCTVRNSLFNISYLRLIQYLQFSTVKLLLYQLLF